MGSLSKVQIKQDKETGNVDMNYFADEISKYIDKSSNTKYFETTPKLDGCSFSAEFTVDEIIITNLYHVQHVVTVIMALILAIGLNQKF